MNQINGQFSGLERHQEQQILPAFHQFLNGNLNENLNGRLNENLNGNNASTSNIVIHLNDSSETIMQNVNLGLHGVIASSNENNTSSVPITSSRKRKKSSAHNDLSFKCSFCPKRFENQSLLNSHVRDCQLVRTHVCEQCGKRFKARGGLQQHARTHLLDEDRPYQFIAQKDLIKNHILINMKGFTQIRNHLYANSVVGAFVNDPNKLGMNQLTSTITTPLLLF